MNNYNVNSYVLLGSWYNEYFILYMLHYDYSIIDMSAQLPPTDKSYHWYECPPSYPSDTTEIYLRIPCCASSDVCKIIKCIVTVEKRTASR